MKILHMVKCNLVILLSYSFKNCVILEIYDKEVNGNGDKHSLCSIINANKGIETRCLIIGALLSRLHFICEIL